jgi:small-conductance mechanosensitive channel
MKWRNIEELLLAAAANTQGILKTPKPFVMVTSLDDYYVEYEINAYTHEADKLPAVYNQLRRNILDNFHKAGVEIMSPHIYAHRQDLELQIPKEDQQ